MEAMLHHDQAGVTQKNQKKQGGFSEKVQQIAAPSEIQEIQISNEVPSDNQLENTTEIVYNSHIQLRLVNVNVDSNVTNESNVDKENQLQDQVNEPNLQEIRSQVEEDSNHLDRQKLQLEI
ncbi:hypothetical protein ACH5RR_021572 [Cinchona calisaya]|uniref:Uncharacterized protein n=1 Tax=Cinchona calisaya TaxID=153742 RepID=A0ABD2ZHX5_9GENT